MPNNEYTIAAARECWCALPCPPPRHSALRWTRRRCTSPPPASSTWRQEPMNLMYSQHTDLYY